MGNPGFAFAFTQLKVMGKKTFVDGSLLDRKMLNTSFVYFRFLPDSIPWLVLKGRWNVLDTMLRKAAQQNNITLPPHVLCASQENSTSFTHHSPFHIYCTCTCVLNNGAVREQNKYIENLVQSTRLKQFCTVKPL